MKIEVSELVDTVNIYWVPIMCPTSVETLEDPGMPGMHYYIFFMTIVS